LQKDHNRNKKKLKIPSIRNRQENIPKKILFTFFSAHRNDQNIGENLLTKYFLQEIEMKNLHFSNKILDTMRMTVSRKIKQGRDV